MKPYYQDKWVTIYHGDCREILPQLPKVDLVLTDPPYPEDKRFSGSWGLIAEVANLTFTSSVSDAWLLSDFLRLGLPNYIEAWKPWVYYDMLCCFVNNTMANCAFGIDAFTPSLVFKKGNPKVSAKQRNLVEVSRAANQPHFQHPSIKYTKAYSTYIRMLSGNDAIILDPFLGSGTTCYCAKKLNRKCIGIEIEEKYCEIAANRCRQEVMEF